MPAPLHVLGVDIGSAAIGIVALKYGPSDTTPAIAQTAYDFHHGDIRQTLWRLLNAFDLTRVDHVAVTSDTPNTIVHTGRYDHQICCIAAARHLHPETGAILYVGSEKFYLIRFDAQGGYSGTHTNTSCAAGTGSFLDQQARRLNLSDAEALAVLAAGNAGKRPQIASRCAVFAKTDLIHAQQQGYRLEQIADGLCHGLARNIVDTVFQGDPIAAPVVLCGGVALNRRVVEHIAALTGADLRVPAHANLFGALGAAVTLGTHPGRITTAPLNISRAADLITNSRTASRNTYPPLALQLSAYPDFTSRERYLFNRTQVTGSTNNPVEVDVYAELSTPVARPVTLGVDIGSTSTKAVLLDAQHEVLAGFYTRTAGDPLTATRHILAAIDDLARRRHTCFNITGCATTGSGRHFIGAVLGADLVLDEISAHARAACELNPDVDTIFEIGGQDAKFTTLKNGMVTSATMNTVCAAGTGSFIEEQARKLGCPLDAFTQRTQGRRAPMTSDRCTVFMERDLNHHLAEGRAVDDVLASVLHAVRENYLLKVATPSRIGNTIFFQGATAKNKALVAAFEQRLKKPILVSRYCHLTGAMGCALLHMDETAHLSTATVTRFRGLGLYRRQIPTRTETCDLCTNHCKLSVADVAGETVAYGFLCGRDYDTRQHAKIKNNAFHLMRARRKLKPAPQPAVPETHSVIVGLPAAGPLLADLDMWQTFFARLGIPTVTSTANTTAVTAGKKLAGAEFCAPMAAMHGHVEALRTKADYIFWPYYLEKKSRIKGQRRQYCYYTQFAPPLAAGMRPTMAAQLLTPVLDYLYTSFFTKIELYRMLRRILPQGPGFFEVAAAYDTAVAAGQTRRQQLQQLFRNRFTTNGADIRIMLLGRPYTVLSPALNHHIPSIFHQKQIDCFYQDMLPYNPEQVTAIRPLLAQMPWDYAVRILEAAYVVAGMPGLYPVLLTSFKCSPDSYLTGYFKQVLEAHNKPYLILELDEHDSSVGYETRIEAAVRAFRNHHTRQDVVTAIDPAPINPDLEPKLSRPNVVLPNWDRLCGKLLEANLRREGFNAVLMTETPTSIQRSMRHNTGQCIPMNAIAQGYIDCIRAHNLDPAQTTLWVGRSEIACNIRLYPHQIKNILRAHGHGLAQAGVYVGALSFTDISLRAARDAYFAYMLGGLLRRVACRLRPCERDAGRVDAAVDATLAEFYDAFLNNTAKEPVLEKMVARFTAMRIRTPYRRPKVALFGDLYTRDNAVMNQNLIRFIEAHGGEVVTTPYTEYAKMIAGPYFRKWFNEGKYLNVFSGKTILATMSPLEKTYYRYFERLLHEPMAVYDDPAEAVLKRYGMRIENTGESMDNVLKVHYIHKHTPDLALFVQVSPALCCPSLVTEAMAARIETLTGVPVVSVTYDGTGGPKNDKIIPYLHYPRKARVHTQTDYHRTG